MPLINFFAWIHRSERAFQNFKSLPHGHDGTFYYKFEDKIQNTLHGLIYTYGNWMDFVLHINYGDNVLMCTEFWVDCYFTLSVNRWNIYLSQWIFYFIHT